ncbi:MAG: PssD/Cps14F family polysaccharide biosynthesis glycosyltransferase [Spirochaetota bacterium]|nr:PssD/Cps14F family polysaccharide biosynthesis glycosyltransferase [Spirochaetota bacterium]
MTKLALIASSGGHLFQLYSLKEFWSDKEHFWVSFPTQDAEYLLKDERVYWAYYPTNRNVINLIRNIFLALKLLRKERPNAIISTGAGVAVPFIFIGKILGIKTIYIESITRNQEFSMSAYLVYPYVDNLLVQWQELADKYKKAQYHGRVI